MRYLSPMRYPGGKGSLSGFIGSLVASQPIPPSRYVEPFAGGAGVGLRMLFGEHVESVVLNDLEPGIAAFWRCVFFDTAALAKRVRMCRPSIAVWRKQSAIHTRGDGDDLELGFATFFLNRTNRSGILLDARPIGGFAQAGDLRIDARYNGERLAERIERLGRYRSRVTVLQEDGISVARKFVGSTNTLVYLDPPYLSKGAELYLNNLRESDHARLARMLADRSGWVLTYDVDARVPTLYPGLRRAIFTLPHTAGHHHQGIEYAIFANSLSVPSLRTLGTNARFVAKPSTSDGKLPKKAA